MPLLVLSAAKALVVEDGIDHMILAKDETSNVLSIFTFLYITGDEICFIAADPAFLFSVTILKRTDSLAREK